MFGWFKNRRRKKVLAQPWPDEWSLHLNRNVRLTWEMDDSELASLQSRVKIFYQEKYWEGCEGLEVSDEMKVTIATQACLLLMGVENFYFDNVKTVLLYPQSFHRQGRSGMSENVSQHRSGEAWQGGPIVLSWKDALRDGRNEDDGRNVVIHEFAHALDGLDGEMGGRVNFQDSEHSQQWEQVLRREFGELVAAKREGRRTLLDHYGATNQAEFFACATETFFERPREMQQEYEALFSLLKVYFQLDPTRWHRRN